MFDKVYLIKVYLPLLTTIVILVLESTDHNATNMLQVYKEPTKYLCGPKTSVVNPFCTKEEKKQLYFVIVGGGIAGLTSARLLLSAGHHVS